MSPALSAAVIPLRTSPDAPPEDDGTIIEVPRPRGGKGWPHAEGTVEAVRRLIEETTLTYHQIAAHTGTSPASISRWMQAGEWKRPLFAPRSMLSVPTPRATANNKHRLLSRRLLALADRYLRELEETPGVDLDKLAQALELARMAKLAAMSRTRRRTDAAMWGEPMRPIEELCAAGVDLHRAPRSMIFSRTVSPRRRKRGRRARAGGAYPACARCCGGRGIETTMPSGGTERERSGVLCAIHI